MEGLLNYDPKVSIINPTTIIINDTQSKTRKSLRDWSPRIIKSDIILKVADISETKRIKEEWCYC